MIAEDKCRDAMINYYQVPANTNFWAWMNTQGKFKWLYDDVEGVTGSFRVFEGRDAGMADAVMTDGKVQNLKIIGPDVGFLLEWQRDPKVKTKWLALKYCVISMTISTEPTVDFVNKTEETNLTERDGPQFLTKEFTTAVLNIEAKANEIAQQLTDFRALIPAPEGTEKQSIPFRFESITENLAAIMGFLGTRFPYPPDDADGKPVYWSTIESPTAPTYTLDNCLYLESCQGNVMHSSFAQHPKILFRINEYLKQGIPLIIKPLAEQRDEVIADATGLRELRMRLVTRHFTPVQWKSPLYVTVKMEPILEDVVQY
jgi:hypothetical protein